MDIIELEIVEKFNPNHGKDGRFTSGKTYNLYHGSPNPNIETLDIKYAGTNTSSGEELIYFTDNKDFATEFSYERLEGSTMFTNRTGKQGKVYDVEVTLKNPLDMRKLSQKDIENIKILDEEKILTDDLIKLYSKRNHQLLKSVLDLRAGSLEKLGYDGLIARARKDILEFGVISNDQVKIKA